MLYTILDYDEIKHCQNMNTCNCMCDYKIFKWNKNHSKAILKVNQECDCCSIHNNMVTEQSIHKILKNDEQWLTKSII